MDGLSWAATSQLRTEKIMIINLIRRSIAQNNNTINDDYSLATRQWHLIEGDRNRLSFTNRHPAHESFIIITYIYIRQLIKTYSICITNNNIFIEELMTPNVDGCYSIAFEMPICRKTDQRCPDEKGSLSPLLRQMAMQNKWIWTEALSGADPTLIRHARTKMNKLLRRLPTARQLFICLIRCNPLLFECSIIFYLFVIDSIYSWLNTLS